jgi:hypothetical protein
MTTVLRRKLPLALISLAISATTFGLVASPTQAAARSNAYTAALATPLSQPRQEIVGGVLWKCTRDRCVAPAGGSRPVLVCERVAKTFGPIVSFSSPAGELSADELTRCNAAK